MSKVYLVYLEDYDGILNQILGIADSIESVQAIAGEDISRPELCTDEYNLNERHHECKYEISSSDPLAQKCIMVSHNHHYL